MAAEKKVPLTPAENPADEVPMSIAKPTKSQLDMFKSTRDPSIAGVETLLTALPHYKLSEAGDWARLHPDEAKYWSPEFCFVNVPVKGQKRDTLHFIGEELAKRYLPSNRIQRFRLALATKPHDVFFLCHVPSQNLDNSFNNTNLQRCGPSSPVASRRASTTTKSLSPNMKTRFRNRAGRRRRWTS